MDESLDKAVKGVTWLAVRGTVCSYKGRLHCLSMLDTNEDALVDTHTHTYRKWPVTSDAPMM